MANHFNIAGEVTQELLAVGDNYNISSISLTNINFGGTTLVDIYIEKGLTGKFYLLKKVKLPIGVTLFHNIVSFDNRHFGLYIKLTKSDVFTLTGTIDVTGTNTNVPGTNTLYLSELAVGDEITVTGETRTIATITSNTAATVTAAWGSDLAADSTPDCSPKSRVDVILS
tara:strand:+ start:871 stop:1380 length:510 start_codon:yes stop_codon:yes gene_type:complete